MDPAVLLAVFKRLTGYPLDSSGNPRLNAEGRPLNAEGSFGLRLPLRREGAGAKTPQTSIPDDFRFGEIGYRKRQYRQVPVYLDGIEVKRWKSVFPSCSVSISDITEAEDYVYDTADGSDGICTAVGSTTVPTSTGGTRTVPDSLVIRKHPETWRVYVTICLYATNPIEMAMLERALLTIFQQKGSIRVEQLDGSSLVRDMVFERYSNMDQGDLYDPGQGIGAEGRSFLKRAFTYRVETVLDNSVDGFGSEGDYVYEKTILETYLEIATIQNVLLETIRLENLSG